MCCLPWVQIRLDMGPGSSDWEIGHFITSLLGDSTPLCFNPRAISFACLASMNLSSRFSLENKEFPPVPWLIVSAMAVTVRFSCGKWESISVTRRRQEYWQHQQNRLIRVTACSKITLLWARSFLKFNCLLDTFDVKVDSSQRKRGNKRQTNVEFCVVVVSSHRWSKDGIIAENIVSRQDEDATRDLRQFQCFEAHPRA